jgi:hypothetical protein
LSTVAVLLQQVRIFSRDPDGTFIEDPFILAWMNEAQRDLAARLKLLDATVTGTVSAGVITLPWATDPQYLEMITLEIAGSKVMFVDTDMFDGYADSATTVGDDTIIARVFNNTVELYPAPANGTAYTLVEKRLPAELTSGDDVVVLPMQLERKIVEYCKFQAMMMLGRTDEASAWLNMYENQLPPPSTGRIGQNPVFLSTQPEATVFDEDARSVSW